MKKKISNYLRFQNDLDSRYMELINEADASTQKFITTLHEYDLLNYSYVALKSYYDISKSKWDLDYRNLFDDLILVSSRVEAKLPIHEMYAKYPDLRVLRRELKENAREAGKITHLMISSSASLAELAGFVSLSSREVFPDKLQRPSGFLSSVSDSEKIAPVTEKPNDNTMASSHAADSFSVGSMGSIASSTTSSTMGSILGSISRICKDGEAPKRQETEIASTLKSHLVTSGKSATTATSFGSSKDHSSPIIHTKNFSGSHVSQSSSSAESENFVPHIVTAESSPRDSDPSYPRQKTQAIKETATKKLQVVHESKKIQKIKASPDQTSDTEVTIRSENLKRRTKVADDSLESQPKRNHVSAGSNIQQLDSWTHEHVECVVNAALDLNDPVNSIQKAFEQKFNVALTVEDVNTLRLHYGLLKESMADTRYRIQTFHSVASQIYDKKGSYVVPPWADIRRQFARQAKIAIPDWEVRSRYHLFCLHRKVYGRLGEPSSNYYRLVDDYHKQMKAKLSSNSSVKATISQENGVQNPQLLDSFPNQQYVYLALDYGSGNSQFKWTNEDIEALIDAECRIPLKINYRSTLIMQFILRKTGKTFPLVEINRRRNEDDIVSAVQRRSGGQKSITIIGEDKSKKALEDTNHGQKDAELTEDDEVVEVSFTSGPVPNTETNQVSTKQNLVGTRSQSQKASQQDADRDLSEDKAQLDILFQKIANETHEDDYYKKKIPKSMLTEFWDFERTKSLMSTIEFISRIKPKNKDITLRIARHSMMKIAMLRLLRDHRVRVFPDMVKNRLKRMMESDVFDDELCGLINSHLEK